MTDWVAGCADAALGSDFAHIEKSLITGSPSKSAKERLYLPLS
jgi:hypothetical protein